MNIKQLDKRQMEVLKLIKVDYSLLRNEIYINDFNDERLFHIDLCDYDLSSFTYELLTEDNEVIPNNVYYYFDDEIEDILYNRYFDTAISNLMFETFNIMNISDIVDDTLYCVYFDYTYQLVFASDEDDALIKVSDMLSDNNYGYNEVTEEYDEILFNFVVKVDCK